MIGFYCIFALEMSRKLTTRSLAVIAFLTLSIIAAAGEPHDSVRGILPDTIVISQKLRDRLDTLSLVF